MLVGSTVFELIKSGISVISMHTNLDIAVSGVNDCLCRALEFDNFEKRPANDGYLLNFTELDTPVSADKLARHIKEKLGGSVKFADSGKSIKKIALCSGSGGGYAFDEKKLLVSNGQRSFRIGDSARIIVEAVNFDKISFRLAE